MKNNLFKYVLIIFIFLIAIFLRVYRLGTAPKGMLVDEPSLAYNAYLILKTGKDEFGNKLPVIFKSFGDYKLPGYIYATVFPVKFFGLNTFSARLPSIVSGIILIFILFFLLKELGFGFYYRALGMLITAVSPWTIILSRFTWEANLGLVILAAALLFLIKGVKYKKPLYFTVAGILMALSSYSYHPYLFVPFAISILFSIYSFFKKNLSLRQLLFFLVPMIFVAIPLLITVFSGDGLRRFKQVNIFTNPQNTVIVNENRTYCVLTDKKTLCYLNSNKLFEYIKIMSNNFVNIFSVKYLFFSGETEKFIGVENFGLFPHFLFVFYLFGLFFLISRKKDKNNFDSLIILGLILSSLPSVVSEPQRIRLTPLYIFILITILYGFDYLSKHFRNFLSKLLVIFLLIGFGFFYIFNYINIHANKYQMEWNFSEDIMNYLKTKKNYDIYFDDLLSEPLMYYAFYNVVDPFLYQRSIQLGERDAIGYQHVTKLGNVYFTPSISPAQVCKVKKSSSPAIYVTNENLKEISPIHVLKSANGIHSMVFFYNVKDLYQSNKCL